MKTRLSLLVFVSVLLLLVSVFPAAAVEAPGVINNGSFEAPLEGSGWSVNSAVGDKRVCDKPAPMPAEGQCMFRFKGGTGKTTLTHLVSPSGLQIVENAAQCGYVRVGTSYYVYSVNAAALGTKVTLKIKLEHDETIQTFKTIGEINDGTPNGWDLWDRGHLVIPPASHLQKIVFSVTHVAPKGKMYVDHVKFNIDPMGPSAC
jgi:hypothetical protein